MSEKTEADLSYLEFGTHPLSSPTNTVILDFESTGLGHMDGFAPLELAAKIINADFEVIATFTSKIFNVSQETLEAMNEYVTKMHTTTGLLSKLLDPVHPRFEADEIDRMFAGFITKFFPKRGEIMEDGVRFRGITIGGNSLAGVDLPALRMFMPVSYAQLDYTTLDVSSVRKLMERFDPAGLAKMPAKGSDHTAMRDIDECISELNYYRQMISA